MRISRNLAHAVGSALAHGQCVIITGPREVGKTTLAHVVAAKLKLQQKKFNVSQSQGLEELKAHVSDRSDGSVLLLIDEVQDCGEAFEFVREGLQSREFEAKDCAKILLIGVPPNAQKLRSQSLGTRCLELQLTPIQPLEYLQELAAGSVQLAEASDSVPAETEMQEVNSNPSLYPLWERGGFPRSLTAASDAESYEWRRQYIDDICQRGLPDSSMSTRRFRDHLRGLAEAHGQCVDIDAMDADLVRCVEFLDAAGLVRILPEWNGEGGRQTKIYVRDSGLLHGLMKWRTLKEIPKEGLARASWEGFCVESVLVASGDNEHGFHLTADAYKAENAQLVLSVGNETWAFDFDRSDGPPDKSFVAGAAAVGADRAIFVSELSRAKSYRSDQGYIVMTLASALRAIEAANGTGL